MSTDQDHLDRVVADHRADEAALAGRKPDSAAREPRTWDEASRMLFGPDSADAERMVGLAYLQPLGDDAYSRGDDGTVPAFDEVNQAHADRDAEPRDRDPLIAQHQDDRDRLATRGDFEGADAAHARVIDMRMRAAREDRERE